MKTNPFAGMQLPRSESDSDISVLGLEDEDEGATANPSTPVTDNDKNKGMLLRTDYSKDPVLLEKDMAALHVSVVEETTLNAIEKLTERTGMPITQENGQRRYGPPLDDYPLPPRGTEVFVGRLPRDCLEPELVPVFERVGQIYELRIMMDFSGTNRGYCFVQYFTVADADRAVAELNNFEIRTGRRIGVVKSVDNCRLYFWPVPRDKTEQQIYHEINKVADGLVTVSVNRARDGYNYNQGSAFVEFESHKAAAMAKRKLMNGKIHLWGLDVAVDWAEPADANCKAKSMIVSTTDGTNKDRWMKTKSVKTHNNRRNQIPRFQNNQNLQGGNGNDELPVMNGTTGQFNLNQTFTCSIQQQAVVHPGVMQTMNQQQMSQVNHMPYPYYSTQQYAPRATVVSSAAMNYVSHGYVPNAVGNDAVNYATQGYSYFQNTVNNATMNVSVKQRWYGVPGVPPDVYYGQWQRQQPAQPQASQ